MGNKCTKKNRQPDQVLVNVPLNGQHQMTPHATGSINGIAPNTQLNLQSTPNFYHHQNNSSFQSQLNSSLSSDRRKDFGEETVIALFPYESRAEGDLSFQ